MRRLSHEIGHKPGHTVEIATLDAPGAPWLRSLPVAHHALGPCWGKYGFARRLLPWLVANRTNYDAVIVNGIWQYHGYAVWRALRKTGTPYYVFPHGMLDPWFQKHYPLKHLKKCLYWLAAEYWILRDARLVLFTTQEESMMGHISFWPHRWRERVVTYGTAAPPDEPEIQTEAFYAKFPGLRGRPFLLFLGRLHEKKGCDLLVKAYAEVKQNYSGSGQPLPDLVLAGPCANPAYMGNLKALATSLGLPPAEGNMPPSATPDHLDTTYPRRLHFLPMLQGDEKWGAFRAAEAFILPSHQENFGIAVAEALSCGTPVLISDKVNIWREIEGDGAGIVEEDTLEGCIKMIRFWIAESNAVRDAMRKQAKASFHTRFEIHASANDLLNALSEYRFPVEAPEAVAAEGTG